MASIARREILSEPALQPLPETETRNLRKIRRKVKNLKIAVSLPKTSQKLHQKFILACRDKTFRKERAVIWPSRVTIRQS